MTLLYILAFGLTAAGMAMGALTLAQVSPRMQHFLIEQDAQRSASEADVRRGVVVNSLVSLSLIFGSTYGLYDWLFVEGEAPLWVYLLEGVTVVLVYDFAYYFAHRFLMHEWKVLRDVHAVHHAAKHPRSVDSFLLHPVETVLGLVLLLGAILAVGGVHLYTFAPVFAAYTTLNVFNHAGLNIPHFPFKTLGVLAVKHDRHHHSMLSGNYASITPLPDWLFGTLE